MTDIKINRGMSSEMLRKELRAFGRFSQVEARAADGGVFVLHEVTMGERLVRYFKQSNEDRQKHTMASRQALLKLASGRPELQALLGKSVLFKNSWTAPELRDALRGRGTPMRAAGSGQGLQVPITEAGQVGVANAKVAMIKADSKIDWLAAPTADGKVHRVSPPDKKRPHTEIAVRRSAAPDDAELRRAYANALGAAKGHVVIAPIDNFEGKPIRAQTGPDGAWETTGIQRYSDESLSLLLDAIDDAKRTNPEITSVTIAAGEYPDSAISGRLASLQAARLTARLDAAEPNGTHAKLPPSLRVVGRQLTGEMRVAKTGMDEADLDMAATPLPNVRTCVAHPGSLRADTTFLQFSEVSRLATRLGASGSSDFAQVVEMVFDTHGLVWPEAREIRRATALKWGIEALELPPCELPAIRLFAMERMDWAHATEDDCKQFFSQHLANLHGRVVIQLSGDATLDKGLWAALQQLSRSESGQRCEFILASPYTSTVQGFAAGIGPWGG